MILDVGLASLTAIIVPVQTFAGINRLIIKDNNSTYDKEGMVSRVLTDAEMEAFTKTGELSWESTTELLGEYSENLLFGNIAIPTEDIVKVALLRTESNDPTEFLVLDSTIDPSELSVMDYEAARGDEYTYYLSFADANGQTSQLFSSNTIVSEYDSFFLISVTQGLIFKFNFDVAAVAITKQDSKTIIKNKLSELPLSITGETFYDEGTVNCLLGYSDSAGNYVDTVRYRKILESVIKDDDIKIIKDRAGNVWKAQTSGFKYTATPNMGQQQQNISFKFTQIAWAGEDG